MRRLGIMAGWALAATTLPAFALVPLDRHAVRLSQPGCDTAAPVPPGGVVSGCGARAAAGGVDLWIVDPADPSRRAATTAFSMLVDPDARAMVTAYDASGRLLGVADRIDAGAAGERLTLSGIGDIARIRISGHGPIAYEDLRIADPERGGHLPEPATWALLMAGFAMTAGVVRRRIRVSEARFTEKMRRIAEGA